ncbi:phosphopantetheine-binding protein [Actinomadura opuntiae]|uniref:phosphopantetheine-binding protein n=1 Tax=Actinomadura sp. OS1-43 TaxID=604315 RepID=UPI00255AEED5|nr:phosphopantetheine-binding protein [Actinomadura sp. OS1-43]MDL4817197.1 phosphopantetheine-binding protein [Actinomadura sp. OS1-43]
MAEPMAAGRPAGDDLADELRRHAARLLPGALVPSVVVELAELPRTPGGKLDRAALPRPETYPIPAGAKPSDQREAALADIFAEVLGLPAVGIDDDFFRLGGTSVHAVRALARMSDCFKIRVQPITFFQGPTVRQLACGLGEGTAS